MYRKDKGKTIFWSLILSVSLIVVSLLLLMFFIYHDGENPTEREKEYESMGILKDSETYEFNDTLPMIPDTSWIEESQSSVIPNSSTKPQTNGNKGVLDEENYHVTTRNDLPVQESVENIIAITEEASSYPMY